ncbi:ThuA domain-containing protein [Luteolibacter sp. AS25]|uniref:ThuA domain-containing protein n=1 Tax=Luteolibacter sp. AS25 TaxID=3135776 RepID=UPI00398B2476
MPRKKLLTTAAFVAISLVFPALLSAAPEKHRVLIVDGFSNHDWKQTTRLTSRILEETGLFTVEVSTAPTSDDGQVRAAWRPDFSSYDAVIQNCNNLQNKVTWPEEVRTHLENYVNSGGGLYILHSANNSFAEWDEYNKMIGLGWRKKDFGTAISITESGEIERIPPGEGTNTGHGPRNDVVLTKLSDHPINKDFPAKWMAADLEQYFYCRGPAENLTVLSYAREPKTGLNFPIEWTVKYGKGNVYNSTYGHVWENQDRPPGSRCIAFQTSFIRAMEWLCSGKTSYPLPENFPTSTEIELGK